MKSFETPNKGFEIKDLPEILSHPVYKEMIQLVNELTKAGLATSSRGNLKATNLNDASGRYLRHTIHYIRAWEYVRLMVFSKLFPVQKPLCVLCLGEGSTPLTFYLASIGHIPVVVDMSPELIENTAKVAEKKKYKIETLCGDMSSLPYEDQSFECILSCSVIEHLKPETRLKAMKEMGRVLKPQGRIGVSFDYGNYSGNPLTGEAHDTIPFESIEKELIEPAGCRPLGGSFLKESENPWVLKKEYWKWLTYYPAPWNLLKKYFYNQLPYSYYTLFMTKA